MAQTRTTAPRPPHLTVASLIAGNGAVYARRPAISARGQAPLAWGDLATQVDMNRSELWRHGVLKGHRVALSLPDGPVMAVAFLSVASTCAAAPLRQTSNVEGARRNLNELKVQHVVVDDESPDAYAQAATELNINVVRLRRDTAGPAGAFQFIPPTAPSATLSELPGPDDDALVVMTSGTTGKPKVAPLSNRVLVRCAYADYEAIEFTPDDCGLIVMPMHHISALRAELLSYLAAGGSAAWVEYPVTDDAITAALRDGNVTTLTASPFYYQAIVEYLTTRGERLEAPALRSFRSSSSGLSAELHARIEAVTGVPVVEDYGSTEAGLVAMNPLPPGIRKAGTVGKPISVEMRIMSDEWEPLPQGATGEIVVRGETVFAGYDSPADTVSKFRDGWFRMGDVGFLDADGYLHLVGRVDDMINRGGDKIDPATVEAVLLGCDGVAEAAAFGLSDSRYGQEVYAAIVVKPGALVTPEELRAAVRRALRAGAPRRVFIVESLARTSTGKLRRRAVAEMCTAYVSGGPSASPGGKAPPAP